MQKLCRYVRNFRSKKNIAIRLQRSQLLREIHHEFILWEIS